jgi:hypothetical protein
MNIREISDIFKDTADNITAIKSYNFGWASDRVRQGNTEDFQELNEFPRVFFAVPTITGSDQTRKQDTYQVTLFFDDLLGYDNEGDEDPTLQIDKWANLQQYANYFVQRLNKIKQSILPNYLFIPEAPSITFDSFTGLQRMITVQLSFNLVVPTNCDPGIITLVQCIANIVTSSNLTASLMTVLKFAASLEGRATVTADINFVQKAEASLLTSAIVTGNITIPKTFNASLLATGTTTADLTVQAAASLLLDLYPSASAAYSLRKLRTAYTGSAVRVRRSSDNTEQDIGFVADELDTVSLLAFCGVGDGFVTTWYDQSGNARNVEQTTLVNQPKIVSSGSLILENGKVSISYDGTNDTLISSNYNFGTTSYSSFVVSRSGGLNSSGRAIYTIKTITPSENGYFHLVFRNNISNNFRSYYSSDGASLNFLIQTPLNVFPTTQNLISNIVPTSGNITFNLNSIQQDSDLAIGQTLNNTIFLIGNYYAGLIESENFFHQGTISELIIYMSNEQSNRTGIESNINTNYAIY